MMAVKLMLIKYGFSKILSRLVHTLRAGRYEVNVLYQSTVDFSYHNSLQPRNDLIAVDSGYVKNTKMY